MDSSEYKELFLSEANEYIQVLNHCLLMLEKQPDDRENLWEIFRVMHSLKGMAGTMGYDRITEVSHHLESFLEELKQGKFSLSGEVIDLLFESLDVLQVLLSETELSGNSTGAQDSMQNLLKKVAIFQSGASPAPWGREQGFPGHTPAGEPEDLSSLLSEVEKELVRTGRESGQSCYLVQVNLRENTLLKSVRAYMAVRALEGFGEVVATFPSMQELDEDKFDLSFQVVLIGDPLLNGDIGKSILSISEVESVDVRSRDEELLPPVSYDAVSATPENEAGSPAVKVAEKTVRVETLKLDELINLVGEMIITRTRVLELGRGHTEELDHSLEKLERITTELQNAAMKLRMMPIKHVFERFPRMVRDISHEKGKQIEFSMSGEETELDRQIANLLSDPLVHLLRNSIDHGIEDETERRKKGKPPAGSVLLKAHHEGSYVLISVEDDGSGIDPKKIKEAALQKGIISKEESSRLKEEDALNLIFQNGFSTSSTVTEVSGRGVGMDAVKKSIDMMHGSLEVQSRVGEGTKFTLRLPLTLAIIKALLVRVADQIYAIPIETIRENLYVQHSEIKTIHSNWVINLRGEVIPLFSLKRLLGYSSKNEEHEEYSVVIVETGDRKAGLVIESLIGQQEIVIKPLGGYLKDIRGIAGATVLGDGRVTLILDVPGLLDNGRVENV